MLTTITHGIVDCSAVPFTKTGTNVTINVVNRKLLVALPHLQRQYLHVESSTLENAWTDVTGNCWLSINIDRVGSVTYTVIEDLPVISATEPALGDFWFDTNVNCWKRRVAPTMFINVIMCVVAKVVGGVVLPFRNNYIEQLFGPTQPLTPIGEIVFDSSTMAPVVTSTPDRYFVTTVDNVKSRVMSSVDVNLANQTITCIAAGTIPAYSAVVIEEFGSASVSPSVVSANQGLIGIVTSGATLGDVIDVHLVGLITNVSWDWSAVGVGVPLYVGVAGQLTHVKPDPNANQVARTVERNSVVFEQPSATVVSGGPVSVEPQVVNLGSGYLVDFIEIKDEFDGSPPPVRLDAVTYGRMVSDVFYEPNALYTTMHDEIISAFGNPVLTHFGFRPLGTCTVNSGDGVITSNTNEDDVVGLLTDNQVAVLNSYGQPFNPKLHVFRAMYAAVNLTSVRTGLDVVSGDIGLTFTKPLCINQSIANAINVTQVDHYVKVGGFGIGLGVQTNNAFGVLDFDPNFADTSFLYDFYVELTYVPFAHNNPVVGESSVWWYIPGIVIRKKPTIICNISGNQTDNLQIHTAAEFDRDVIAINHDWSVSPLDGVSIDYIDFRYPSSATSPSDTVNVSIDGALINITVYFDQNLVVMLEFDTTAAVGDRLFFHEITRGEGLGE